MAFLAPKPPKPLTPANSPFQAKDSPNPLANAPSFASLISTSSSGLRRKAFTQRTSLIGGP